MAKRNARARSRRQPKKRSALHDIVACILPILCVAGSLAGAYYIFQLTGAKVAQTQSAIAGDDDQPSPGNSVVEPAYAGVEDPWITAGTFTVGIADLDESLKSFCDKNTPKGATVDEAAQETYNAIVQSNYVDMLEKPSGTNWVPRSAQQFFSALQSNGAPEGDYYEFAAVTALCLRYFGYSDAIAVPVLHSTDSGGQYGSALCLVTNKDGVACVCDPALGTSGWMLKRAGYDILVDDIGQDLSTAEGLGLKIQLNEEHAKSKEFDENSSSGSGSYGTGTSTETGYGTDTGYGTGTTTGTGYGTDTGYGTGTSTGTGYGTDTGYGTGTSTGTGTTTTRTTQTTTNRYGTTYGEDTEYV